MDDLGITEDVTNVNGGAIALGHPIGMSGTRLAHHAAERARAAAAAAPASPPSAVAAARATLSWCGRRPEPAAGGGAAFDCGLRESGSVPHFVTSLERPPEGQLVGVLEVASDG